jgi:hypothetical protein
MMHVLACDEVRNALQAYHDGELSIDEQVLVQGHLRDCIACAIEAAELEELGETLRAMSTSLPDRVTAEMSRLPGQVLERVRVEQQLSMGTRLRALFEDMHFVWAALGATCATLVCVFASMGVLQAASRERPDSLAGIIDYLANPGSNANPVPADGWMLLPRAVFDPPMPLGDEDAVVALSAVVTREGRVEKVELVAEQARRLRVKPEVVLAMIGAASRARFSPAQARGETVAVSVVWLLETTTVKGRADYDMYLVTPPRLTAQVPVTLPRPKPVVQPVPSKPAPSTEACNAG